MTDPLSNLLSLAKTTSSAGGGLLASHPWAIEFSKLEKIKCYGILRGQCWLIIEKAKVPILINEGDVILLSGLKSYVIASAPKIKPINAKQVFPSNKRTFAKMGPQAKFDFEFVGGHTVLDTISSKLLQVSLPKVVHIKSSNPQSKMLIGLLQQLANEFKDDRPGSEAICNQLSHLIFLQVLRSTLDKPQTLPPGWLRAMSQTRIAPAIYSIHNRPGETWTVAKLAKAASLSRTTFMEIFKQETALAPLQYLTEWRMILSRQLLINKSETISNIAFAMGYSSESSFSHAFKRVVGKSPKAFRDE